jgi:hypothetical protein
LVILWRPGGIERDREGCGTGYRPQGHSPSDLLPPARLQNLPK